MILMMYSLLNGLVLGGLINAKLAHDQIRQVGY
jgi:hypothetical protein